jgi:hypothetical protein
MYGDRMTEFGGQNNSAEYALTELEILAGALGFGMTIDSDNQAVAYVIVKANSGLLSEGASVARHNDGRVMVAHSAPTKPENDVLTQSELVRQFVDQEKLTEKTES